MKRTIFISGIIALVCSLNIYISYGQEIEAKIKSDTNNVLIGDQVKLRIELKTDKNVKITWPAIPDSIGKVEILSKTKIDTLDTNQRRIYQQDIVVTSFDSGHYEIPPFTFMYEKKGMSSLYPAQTEPLYLKFRTVAVDTTKPIKDIKGPLEVPFIFADYIPYLIALIVIAVIVYLFIYYRKHRKPKEIAKLDYDPRIPAHIVALEALKALDAEKLWQKGQVKLFFIRLTEIVRTYIERRFEIPALEMVTDEIVESLNAAKLDGDLIEKLKNMLTLADLVKFAKHQPLPDDISLAFKTAVEFVQRTVLNETVSTDNKQEAIN